LLLQAGHLAKHTQHLLVTHATSSAGQAAPASTLQGLQALREALAAQQQQQHGVEGLVLALGHKVVGDAALAQVRSILLRCDLE
jgi:hypothetical protein